MRKITFILISFIIISYSCKKETDETIVPRASEDHLKAESIFNEIGSIVEDGLLSNNLHKSCPTYTLQNNDSLNADTLTIDFGSSNCLAYGKLRKGKIYVVFSGKYSDPGTVITTTFDNYHVNENNIMGIREVTNNGINSQGNIEFIIEVINASITLANNQGTINWESTRTREWIEGSSTLSLLDDKYLISGDANGTGRNGTSFNTTISTPLLANLNCLLLQNKCLLTSGQIDIIPNGLSTRTINYGDSVCDCNFTVTINGNIYPIYL